MLVERLWIWIILALGTDLKMVLHLKNRAPFSLTACMNKWCWTRRWAETSTLNYLLNSKELYLNDFINKTAGSSSYINKWWLHFSHITLALVCLCMHTVVRSPAMCMEQYRYEESQTSICSKCLLMYWLHIWTCRGLFTGVVYITVCLNPHLQVTFKHTV